MNNTCSLSHWGSGIRSHKIRNKQPKTELKLAYENKGQWKLFLLPPKNVVSSLLYYARKEYKTLNLDFTRNGLCLIHSSWNSFMKASLSFLQKTY